MYICLCKGLTESDVREAGLSGCTDGPSDHRGIWFARTGVLWAMCQKYLRIGRVDEKPTTYVLSEIQRIFFLSFSQLLA